MSCSSIMRFLRRMLFALRDKSCRRRCLWRALFAVFLVSDAVCLCRHLVMFCNNQELTSVSRRCEPLFSSEIFLLVLLGRGFDDRKEWMVSGFRRDVNENGALLGYYAAYSGNWAPTFRDNLWVPFARVEQSKKKMGTIGCLEMSERNYHSTLDKNPRRMQISS